jgi:hypothetical protein
MTASSFRYCFAPSVPIREVEDTLRLASLAACGLYGDARVRLEAPHRVEADARRCVIGAGTPVGDDLNKIFLGLVTREFGEGSVEVEAVPAPARRDPLDSPEYRTFSDWSEELDLEPDLVELLRRAEPSLRPSTPLTARQIDDVIRLAQLRA